MAPMLAGSIGWLLSSSTTVSAPSATTGPCPWMLSLSCSPVPENPVSDEPIESVKNALGNAYIQTSLTGRLKIAALLETRNRLATSYGVPVRESVRVIACSYSSTSAS